MAVVPTPVRASVRDLLRDLVGRGVTVSPAEAPLELAEDATCWAATYRFDDGRVAAMAVCDLAAASSLGGAIGMMGRPEVEAELAQHGTLDGDLKEFFHEVVNVSAKLLNSPTSPHVALRELDAVPGEVRVDAARVALQPAARVDLEVVVDGFDPGRLTLLTV